MATELERHGPTAECDCEAEPFEPCFVDAVIADRDAMAKRAVALEAELKELLGACELLMDGIRFYLPLDAYKVTQPFGAAVRKADAALEAAK